MKCLDWYTCIISTRGSVYSVVIGKERKEDEVFWLSFHVRSCFDWSFKSGIHVHVCVRKEADFIVERLWMHFGIGRQTVIQYYCLVCHLLFIGCNKYFGSFNLQIYPPLKIFDRELGSIHDSLLQCTCM